METGVPTTDGARSLAVVIESGLGLIVTAKVLEAVIPAVSLTVTVKVKAPLREGVPERVPEPSRVRPGTPPAADQV
jgi:hypothetical protein